MRALWSCFVLGLLSSSSAFAAGTAVKDLETRPGVTQRFLLITPEKPVAAVILFAGGEGGLNISADGGFGWGRGNFLVRSRELFARHELLVAVIDAPSDRLPSPALDFFRDTAAHAEDVRHVIAALRKEANVPVWLVGTSRGTTSVANAAIRLKDAQTMFGKLAAAPKKEFLTFKGGGPPKGPPCEAFHYHGFIGIEAEVVDRIADWIKANSKR